MVWFNLQKPRPSTNLIQAVRPRTLVHGETGSHQAHQICHQRQETIIYNCNDGLGTIFISIIHCCVPWPVSAPACRTFLNWLRGRDAPPDQHVVNNVSKISPHLFRSFFQKTWHTWRWISVKNLGSRNFVLDFFFFVFEKQKSVEFSSSVQHSNQDSSEALLLFLPLDEKSVSIWRRFRSVGKKGLENMGGEWMKGWGWGRVRVGVVGVLICYCWLLFLVPSSNCSCS